MHDSLTPAKKILFMRGAVTVKVFLHITVNELTFLLTELLTVCKSAPSFYEFTDKSI